MVRIRSESIIIFLHIPDLFLQATDVELSLLILLF